VRAKLATPPGWDKIMSKSCKLVEICALSRGSNRSGGLVRKKRPQEDEDLRVPPNDSMKKIIISSDDEQCIKAGTMTKEQEKQLMNKIIAQIEHQKLKEAQLKDKEESSVGSLQPVSDEELDFGEEGGEGKFGDKDDRVSFHKFPRESRRGGPYWRGKRRHWENPHPGPHPRPAGIRPWLHQMNAWRPIGPNFPARPQQSSEFGAVPGEATGRSRPSSRPR
jgi:hypothetical protein